MSDLLLKVKSFFQRNKKGLFNLFIMLLGVIAISVISFLMLLAFGIVNVNDGIHFNTEVFDSFRNSWYGWIIFILLQTVLSILLCAIPGAAMAFIFLSQAIYSVPWQAFLLSFSSVMIASTVMYSLGRLGGYKICVKMLGEEDCAKSLGLLRDKGTVYFPLMMMFPIFPDDALVMIAGTLKMSLKWFIPSIVVGRGIGIATVVFGFSIVPFDKFTTPWHWIGFIAFCAAAVFCIFFCAHKFNKYMSKRRQAEGQTEEAPAESCEEISK